MWKLRGLMLLYWKIYKRQAAKPRNSISSMFYCAARNLFGCRFLSEASPFRVEVRGSWSDTERTRHHQGDNVLCLSAGAAGPMVNIDCSFGLIALNSLWNLDQTQTWLCHVSLRADFWKSATGWFWSLPLALSMKSKALHTALLISCIQT